MIPNSKGRSAPSRSAAAQQVLALVARIPRGRVMTYGQIAAWLELYTPRQVGSVLSIAPAGSPWHRVVRADGRMAESVRHIQRELLVAEGVGIRRNRVDLKTYQWNPSWNVHRP